VKAQQAPEILTTYPFFALNFLLGANDVPRVYADVFRFALQLNLLQSLERFGGILRSLRTSLQAVLWYHTQLQFEVASLAQQEGWLVQLELPYGNGTGNKSDVCLSRGEAHYPIEAVTLRLSESGRKKRVYADWLSNWSIQLGVDITGRIGEPGPGEQKKNGSGCNGRLTPLCLCEIRASSPWSPARTAVLSRSHGRCRGILER